VLDFGNINHLLHKQYVDKVERLALPFGDYAAQFKDGFRPAVFFERKSLADLWGTLANQKNHKRFKTNLLRSIALGAQLVLIIERPLTTILKGHKFNKSGRQVTSAFSGYSMVKLLGTLRARHGLEVICCKDRSDMALEIANRFIGIGRERYNKK